MSEQLEFYLARLRDGEDVLCRLLDLDAADPAVLPRLAAEFDREPARDVRAALLEVIWQTRDPRAIPVLDRALADPAPKVWKEALDGLVAVFGPEAITVLETALARATGERAEWIAEALDQARDAELTRSPAVATAPGATADRPTEWLKGSCRHRARSPAVDAYSPWTLQSDRPATRRTSACRRAIRGLVSGTICATQPRT